MRRKQISKSTLLILIVINISCNTEFDKEPNNNINEMENCIESILYNVREGSTTNQNFKIGLTKNGENFILVEDENFDFWWPRLHPSKDFFICYKSPIGDNKPTNDYSRAELWRFNLDGTNGIKLIDLEKYGWQAQGTADWSPDGEFLIMHALVDDLQHLFRTDMQGNNLIQVSSGIGHKGDPSWSVDGTQIIYTGFPEDYDWSNPLQAIIDKLSGIPLEIHLADISQSGQLSNILQITDDEIADFDPYMSPDGNFIAWESLEGLVGVMNMYNKTTNQISKIIDNDNAPCCPSWRDNSSEFLYHIFKPFVTFHIAKYNLETEENTIMLQEPTTDYSNPQVVCWPN